MEGTPTMSKKAPLTIRKRTAKVKGANSTAAAV